MCLVPLLDGLDNVLYMPRASQPIISVGIFWIKSGVHSPSRQGPQPKKTEKIVATRDERGLYTTCVSPEEAKELTSSTAGVYNALGIHAQILRERIHMLHRSLGHIGKPRMLAVLRRNRFTNLKPSDLELLLSCDACHTGTIQKANRPKENTKRETEFGDMITTDTTSKQNIATRNGKRYANVAVDEASRWSFVRLLRRIRHTKEVALEPLLRTELKGLTKTLRSDMGTEFKNKRVDKLLKQLGIRRETACADNHHQNGLAERTIGVLFEMVRTMLADSRLPLSFWANVSSQRTA
jgi:transposase InsO family protein